MNNDELKAWGCLSVIGLFVLVAATSLGMWGCPRYNVWQQGLQGEAKLREAESSRQILVEEAKAKKESAKMLAEAEVERAKGVAQANQIIGKSLQGNESYLRYLWIQGLDSSNPTVVYVPTEASLPVLEAGRLPSAATKAEK
jgi:regulator of protease activity HflC (stomatin/prohibitin superfamily)